MATKIFLRPGDVMIQMGGNLGVSVLPDVVRDDNDVSFWRAPGAVLGGSSGQQAKGFVADLPTSVSNSIATVVAVRAHAHMGIYDDQTASSGTTPINIHPAVGVFYNDKLVSAAQGSFIYNIWPGVAFDYTKHGTIVTGEWAYNDPDGAPWTVAKVNNLQWWMVGSNSNPFRLYGAIEEVYVDVLYAVAPSAPAGANVFPAASATISTDTPVLRATINPPSSGQRIKMEWQLATNSTFTTNVKTFRQADARLAVSGTTSDSLPASLALFPGTWFIRARQVDEYGNVSGYSSNHSFTVSHASTANNLQPSGGGYFDFGSGLVNFSWTFGDTNPLDHQTAYQISAEVSSTATEFYNSGKIASSASNRNVSISASWKGTPLRWHVQTWDEADQSSGYTGYQTFIIVDEPTVTIISPTDESNVDNGRPAIEWDAVDHTGLGIDYHQVIFRRVSDNALIFDSGKIFDTATTFTPPRNILKNNTDYSVQVFVTDKGGLTGIGSITISVFFIPPDQVFATVDTSDYEIRGYVLIDWSAAVVDPSILSWNVYRKRSLDIDWTLIATFPSEIVRTYKDWLAPSGDDYQYAVTQIVDRSGSDVESDIDDNTNSFHLENTQYWLINPADESANTIIPQVTDDSYTPVTDSTSYIVIGRGRRTDYGTYAGVEGSLTARFRDDVNSTARQKKLALEAARRTNGSYKLKTPFGDIYQVSIGDIQISRIAGVSTNEFVDVSIPYSEVF